MSGICPLASQDSVMGWTVGLEPSVGRLQICLGMSRIPWMRCEGAYISHIVWDCIGTILL